MKKEYISLSHFKKYLTCQPFFVWNSLEKDQKIENEEELWDLIEEEILEKKEKRYWEIVGKSFRLIDQHLIEYLKQKYDCVFIKGKTIEEKIKHTKESLNLNKMLIKPIFEYKNAIATPLAFDLKEKKLINLKYSKKTKLINLIDFKWDKEIISKSIKVKKFTLFLLKDKFYQKGEIDLISTNKIYPTKTGNVLNKRADKEVKIEFLIDQWKYFKKEKIEDIINKINSYKKIKKVDLNIKNDITLFGFNKELDLILEKNNFEFTGFNGFVIRKSKIIDFFKQKELDAKNFFSSKVLDEFLKLKKRKLINFLFLDSWDNQDIFSSTINKILLANKVVWYDFEAFSLPFSPLNGYGPYDQVIFQASIIKTNGYVEIDQVKNIIFDPKNISHENFFEIVKNIYSKDVDCYVVYNKSYEISKIEKMLEILKLENYQKVFEFEKMVNHIKSKTVDLMDLFKIISKNKIPPIMLSDQKLRYSIKNIEKHISQNQINLPRKIKEYEMLEIQNGLMAMETAIKRSIGLIGDLEWKSYEKKLKKYCENDVKAMIMVYDFALSLIK